MFEPSSVAILWILGALGVFLTIVVLITIVAIIFSFIGPPQDINDVDIEGNPKKIKGK